MREIVNYGDGEKVKQKEDELFEVKDLLTY